MKKKELTITEMARMGGNSTLKKHGTEHFKELRRKGIEKAKQKLLDKESKS